MIGNEFIEHLKKRGMIYLCSIYMHYQCERKLYVTIILLSGASDTCNNRIDEITI